MMSVNRAKLKILQVTAALNEGGVERGTVEMAAFTVSQGAESYVASNGGKLVAELEASGGIHNRLPLDKRTPWHIAYCAWRLMQIIREKNIGLVHARSRAPAWAAFIACRLTDTKFITTFHGTHKIQNRFKWFYNSVMTRGERVIAISEFIKQHICDNYQVPEDCIDVAPRGFDPAIFDPVLYSDQDCQDLRQSLGIKPDELVVSLPGRLTRWKGQTIFLQALSEVKDLPWRALLIGGAGKKIAYQEELKRLITDLKISDRVIFLGSRSDIARCYAASDLIVSASIEPEAFGRVAIEAQAMGKPVIATAHGGALETVQDGVTGWYCQPSGIDLSEKLRHALDDPAQMKRLGTAGREWVQSKFTVEKMCAAEWAACVKVFNS